jgi:hypothetical protein
MDAFGLRFDFTKAAPNGDYVAGFASVTSVGGKPVTDHEGDVIRIDELRKAAHRFITDVRVAKVMHGQDGTQTPIGEVVESVIIDDAFAKALGVTDPRRGLWIGMKIHDTAVQARVAKGELKAFSLGGRGKRTAL